MTTRFVGPGGSDAADGLTWANRKLTLNGVEDTPVTTTDVVYVGPGTYREEFVADVSGTAGNEITYIGDITAENTDGIGGAVILTGSDDDRTVTRSRGISSQTINYRTFRGFRIEMFSVTAVETVVGGGNGGTNWIIEDCTFQHCGQPIYCKGNLQDDWIIRRCVFVQRTNFGGVIRFAHGSTLDDIAHLVENCIFIGGNNVRHIFLERVGGGTVKNCLFIHGTAAIHVVFALTVAQKWDVNNCALIMATTALQATTTGEIVEDFNTFFENQTARTNVAVGSNSQAYAPLFNLPLLLDGVMLGAGSMFAPAPESIGVARIAGTGEATDDIYGIARPTTSAKKSWGAIQLREAERDTATVRTGAASVKLADAGDHSLKLPVDGTSITIACYARFETDYAGTKPRMIIRQAGQTDDVTTAVGAVDTWEQLTTTLTPAADPPWVEVILRSLNTASAGSFATLFDDLEQT